LCLSVCLSVCLFVCHYIVLLCVGLSGKHLLPTDVARPSTTLYAAEPEAV